MYIANYPVDNPSGYWKMSLCLVFFDYFVEEISNGVVINKERFFLWCGGKGLSYNNPASLLNLTHEHLSERFTKESRFYG
jgi:hypothetical protein